MVSGFFYFLFWLLSIAAFVVSLYAFVDASRRPAEAFPAMDKQTKQLWLIVLGVGSAIALLAVFTNFRFLWILAIIAALIYLLDVRPAIKDLGGPNPW